VHDPLLMELLETLQHKVAQGEPVNMTHTGNEVSDIS